MKWRWHIKSCGEEPFHTIWWFRRNIWPPFFLRCSLYFEGKFIQMQKICHWRDNSLSSYLLCMKHLVHRQISEISEVPKISG